MRWLIVFCGVTALLGAAVVRAQPRPDPRAVTQLLDRAERSVAQPRRALPLVRRALARAPGSLRGVELLVRVLPLPMRAAEVVDPLDAALRARVAELRARIEEVPAGAPEDAARVRALRRMRAWCLALDGDVPAAIVEMAGTAQRLEGLATEMLREMAALAVRRGALREADDALEAARLVTPQSAEVVHDLARIRLARGLPEAAAALLRRLLERSSGDLEARRLLGSALLASGQARAGAAVLAELAFGAPDDASLQLDLARAALESGDAETAERAAARAAELEPTEAEACLLRGQALVRLERREEARAAYEEALGRHPGDVRATAALRLLVR